MKLSKYDNKIIRLEDKFGDVYEGICCHNSKDYNEHEYGKYEESLQMSNTIFYNSIIKKVEIIDEFSDKYGKLEEEVIDAGLDLIDEVLTSEEEISVYRLLCCLDEKELSFSKEDEKKLIELLENLIKYNEDKRNVEMANKLLKKIVENK